MTARSSCNVGRSFRLALFSALVALIVFAVGPLDAAMKPAAVFSGMDLGKYFKSVWLPEYPYTARMRKLSGRGTFRAFVDAKGKVTRVIVVRAPDTKIWMMRSLTRRCTGTRETLGSLRSIFPSHLSGRMFHFGEAESEADRARTV